MLSSNAHSSISGMMRNVIPEIPDLSRPTDGLRLAASGITLQDLALRYISLPMALGRVSGRLYDLMGWQRAGMRAAVQMTLATWRRAAGV
jgi:hypothetical protein